MTQETSPPVAGSRIGRVLSRSRRRAVLWIIALVAIAGTAVYAVADRRMAATKQHAGDDTILTEPE